MGGATVWLHSYGDIKKVAANHVKPYEDERSKVDIEKKQDPVVPDGKKHVMLEDGLQDLDMLHAELEKDMTGAKYLKMQNSVSFSDICSYVIELPVSEHGRPEVIAAKEKEIEDLMDYSTFEEVADEGQDVIGSRWVITVKEKHDGQKQQCKARLVARCFQESYKPQSDSPTVLKDSFKLLMAVAANNGFRLASVDIRAAFFKSKSLDQDVFVKPPKTLI